MTVKILKYCAWSFRKRLRAKQIVEYAKGAVVTNLPEKDEEEMINADYAVKATEKDVITEDYVEAPRVNAPYTNQVVEVETKDIKTKPIRNVGKTADDSKSDNKSDKV